MWVTTRLTKQCSQRWSTKTARWPLDVACLRAPSVAKHLLLRSLCKLARQDSHRRQSSTTYDLDVHVCIYVCRALT